MDTMIRNTGETRGGVVGVWSVGIYWCSRKPFLGEQQEVIRLDVRIPPRRYVSFTRELVEMAVAYQRGGDPRRAAGHYRKALELCQTMRRSPEFWGRVAPADKERLADREREATKSLNRYSPERIQPQVKFQEPLRPLVIPAKVVEAFFSCWNGEAGFKGLLGGSVAEGGRLAVTHLFVVGPEREIPLLTLGWARGQPGGELQLSGHDLSSLYAHQSFLPEAVAVVCSPAQSRVFRLTLPGLRALSTAPLALFPPAGLYSDAAHCIVDHAAPITVVDLRAKLKRAFKCNKNNRQV